MPVHWNSVHVTDGSGSNLRISERRATRPIVDMRLSSVARDLAGLDWWPDTAAGLDLSFLDGKRLTA